jgi:Zn finger protein HypA/HybF involved in hydrogenase expression
VCGKPKIQQNKYCKDCADQRLYKRITVLDDAKSDRIRKRVLIEQRGHQCEVCGLSEWQSQAIPIELDHIDGDADNNNEENLRLICPNCHAQTDTYKGANMGVDSSRQRRRRKRYAGGETY